MVSIVDIARAAGVSHQVVSKALHGGESKSAASPATRTRIQELAREMGYRRSGAGRAMREGRYFSVGLVVGSGDDFLLPEAMVSTLAARLSEAGYTCTLYCAESKSDAAIFTSPLLTEVRSDCLIISYVRPLSPDIVARVENLGTPVVWLNREARTNCIYVDERQGALLLTKHLKEQGHRHLTLVDYSTDLETPFFRARFEAMQDYCAEHGLMFSLIQKKLPREKRSAHVEEWLKHPNRPTAIVANSLSSAQIICQTAVRCGLRLPEDLAVASFDNGNWHQANCPAITCAVRSDAAFGEAVAASVLARLKQPSVPVKSTSFAFTLSQGGTTFSSNSKKPKRTKS